MKCPQCLKTTLVASELEPGLAAGTCEPCGGAWISHRNYEAWRRLQVRDVPAAGPATELAVSDIPKAKVCPQCGRLMLKYRVGHGLAFSVDHCDACGGIWLDRDEWAALKRHGLHDNLYHILTAAWQKAVRDEGVRARMDEVYLSRLGRETFARAKEIRAWLADHPEKALILAFIADQQPHE